jgi:hypothetical protein
MTERDQPKPEDATKVTDVQPNLALAEPDLPARSQDDAALDPEVQAFIGRHLKAVYDQVLAEPVPDRLIELLEQLEQGKAGKS